REQGPAPAAPEHRFVWLAVVSSYVLAELGDKTMLATVALASDHNWAGVRIGATVAMVLADGLAVLVGALLHPRLPDRMVPGSAGVLFLMVGCWLLPDGGVGWRGLAGVVTSSTAVAAAVVAIVVPMRARVAARKAIQ